MLYVYASFAIWLKLFEIIVFTKYFTGRYCWWQENWSNTEWVFKWCKHNLIQIKIKRYYGLCAEKPIKSMTMYMYKLLHKRCRSRYASVQTFDVLFVFAWFDLNLFYCIKEYKKFRFKICQLTRTLYLNLFTNIFSNS